MSEIVNYGARVALPGMVEGAGEELPEGNKPRLVCLSLRQTGWDRLLYESVRKRIAVVLDEMEALEEVEGGLEKLLRMGQAARRNDVPVVVLGSWRYAPAVAALKELAASGCLGKDLNLTGKGPKGQVNQLRLRDMAAWLGAKAQVTLEDGKEFHLTLSGENGQACVCFTLEEHETTMQICINGHVRERYIPAGDYLVSERAVLALSYPMGVTRIRHWDTMAQLIIDDN